MHYTRCFRNYIRSGLSIIRGAFNIISIYSFHVYDFTIAYINLVCDYTVLFGSGLR